MGTESSGDHVYDLRRIEDVFACLEIISIARGAMFGVDPEIARRMEKVSDALGALAQIVMDGELAGSASAVSPSATTEQTVMPGEKSSARERELDVLADLTSDVKLSGNPVTGRPRPIDDGKRSGGGEERESIVDILTGEKIK